MSELTSEQLRTEDDFRIDPVERLQRDIKKAAATMTNREARYLVDTYYQRQEDRIRAQGQIRSMEKAEQKEPHQTIDWILQQSDRLENSIRSVLGEYARHHTVGRWSQSICGIGPVISAGLIAFIGSEVWECMADPEEKRKRRRPADQCTPERPCSAICHTAPVETVSRVWRYAGLDPTVKWGKGEKRPWSARLKTICWHVGQCFMRVSNNEKDFYGQYFKYRKRIEIENNDRGQYADQAERTLTEKNYGQDTEARQWYEGRYPGGTMKEWSALGTTDERAKLLKSRRGEPGSGTRMLPPAHIQQRAERYATKLFLSHWHQVAFFDRYSKLPPAPFVMAHLGHTDFIQVPNWPWPEQTQISALV